MEKTRMEKTRTRRLRERPSFDITCVVGTVFLDETADRPAHVVAMMMIGEHDAPGVYEFPLPDGGINRVTVEHVNPDGSPLDPLDDEVV